MKGGPLNRTFDRLMQAVPQYASTVQENQRLLAEREALLDQRTLLASERDELKGHTNRLARELAEAHAREQALRDLISGLEKQRDTLAAERDELSEHAKIISASAIERERQAVTEREGLLARHQHQIEDMQEQWHKDHEVLESQVAGLSRLVGEPGARFYSPVVDTTDPHVQTLCDSEKQRFLQQCDAVNLDMQSILGLFHDVARHYPQCGFPIHRTAPNRYYLENPFFSYSDAFTLFGLLSHFRPRRLIEIGVGFSSAASMDTNDFHLSGAVEMTFVDPNPERLLDLLAPDDPYRERVLPHSLQETPTDLFRTLERNDILFLDTSHVLKTGSDVNDYLFRVLPALQPGVLVHIHDIFYPFEYSAEWVLEQKRSWNEAYAVRAFLEYNDAFEVIYFNDIVYNRHRDLTRQLMPMCLRNTGGSLWMRKTRA